MRKLAVLFPGIGYTPDRPLLHFTRRIAADLCYEIRPLPYTGFPSNVRGDREKMIACFELALTQAKEMLSDVDWAVYDDILFIGKSVGTIVAAALAAQNAARPRIRQVIYTPLEDTFSFPIRDGIVFTGSEDPWVGGSASRIPALCRERGLPCSVIPGGNHSLETSNWADDLAQLRDVLQKTEQYIRRECDRLSCFSRGTLFPAKATDSERNAVP